MKYARETSYAKWEVNLLVNSILNVILDSLEQGTDVCLKKFGKFELKTQKARKVHYPNNNVTISVPEKVKVIFNVHRCFKVEDEILEKISPTVGCKAVIPNNTNLSMQKFSKIGENTKFSMEISGLMAAYILYYQIYK